MFSNKKSPFIRHQVGFSIIEMMIAIPLGMLVVGAVLKIFTSSIEGVHLQNDYSRVQENGRMATELMVRDIRGADYWGCAGDIGQITNNLDTTDTSYDESTLPTAGSGISGNNNVISMTIAGIDVKDATDTLTLRGAGSLSGVKVSTPYMPTTAAVIHIDTVDDIAKGKILLITDCREGDLFMNTKDTTPSNAIIGHNTGVTVAGSPSNQVSTLSHTYDGSAQILNPFSKVYFIGVNPSGSHSLYRSDDGVAKELLRGVNDLQLMYGEDSSDNGSANIFTATPANMDNVISIRASITAESAENASGASLDRTYHTTANIRNRTLQ